MYRVYVNDLLIHDQAAPDPDAHLISPKLILSDNAAGSFDFTIPKGRLGYDDIRKMSSTIIVLKENHTIWSGRVTKGDEDFFGNRKFTCEGALAYLNDTLQPNIKYTNISNKQYFINLIKNHNAKVREDRRFAIGSIAETGVSDLFDHETDFQKTISLIQSDFIELLGGHIYITYNDDYDISNSETPTPILNYTFDYNPSSQEINFGKNLLNFTKNWDTTDLFTVVYPRGAQLESTTLETTVSSTYVSSSDNDDDITIII